MRIGIIGKYPPIQGGVSTRTYLTAHALAARGHEIHVVTNAKEVRPPFRMHMRAEDWARCEPSFGRGAVMVHWSDPVDRSQTYIPTASPYVTKLAGIAAKVHAERPFDVILSHYLEPYGVAGHLAAQMTGAPHVVRTAGSDAGRLWHHPQFEALYDHVLRSAELVVAAGTVAERAVRRGVASARIVPGGGYRIPEELFAPDGPKLELAALRRELERDHESQDLLWGEFAGDLPYFGVYGKLGDNKGSFALLEAMHRLKLAGLQVGLAAMAHGRPEIERRFRERALALGLADRVLQLPFLPHWRVPAFLRGCLAVCCLEQGFPIGFHSPIVPLEVLLCGACLVASTEMIRKLPDWQRLPHGYGCVAIENVEHNDELCGKLAAIVRQPNLTKVVGARGRAFALDGQTAVDFPERIERILEAAAERRSFQSAAPTRDASGDTPTKHDRFLLTRIAAAKLAHRYPRTAARIPGEAENDGCALAFAKEVLRRLRDAIAAGLVHLQPYARAVEMEIAVVLAEGEPLPPDRPETDPLFRLRPSRWALGERELGELVPLREGRMRVLEFQDDIAAFRDIRTAADFPTSVGPGPSYLIVFREDVRREPLLVDRFTARILELSDGTRTAHEIVEQLQREFERTKALDHLAWIENLLVSGLLGLENTRSSSVTRQRRAGPG